MTVIPRRCAWCVKYELPCGDFIHDNPLAEYVPIVLAAMPTHVPVVPGRPLVRRPEYVPRDSHYAGRLYMTRAERNRRRLVAALALVISATVFAAVLVLWAHFRPHPAPGPVCVSTVPSCAKHATPAATPLPTFSRPTR